MAEFSLKYGKASTRHYLRIACPVRFPHASKLSNLNSGGYGRLRISCDFGSRKQLEKCNGVYPSRRDILISAGFLASFITRKCDALAVDSVLDVPPITDGAVEQSSQETPSHEETLVMSNDDLTNDTSNPNEESETKAKGSHVSEASNSAWKWGMDSEGITLLITAVGAATFFDFFQKERSKFQTEMENMESTVLDLKNKLKVETESVSKALTELRRLEISKGYGDEKVLRMQMDMERQQKELENWQKEVNHLRIDSQGKANEIERIVFELMATKLELGQKSDDLAEIRNILSLHEDIGIQETLDVLKSMAESLLVERSEKEKLAAVTSAAQQRIISLREELAASVQDFECLTDEMKVLKMRISLLDEELKLSHNRNTILEMRIRSMEFEESFPDEGEGEIHETSLLVRGYDSFDEEFKGGKSSKYAGNGLPSEFNFVVDPVEAAVAKLPEMEEDNKEAAPLHEIQSDDGQLLAQREGNASASDQSIDLQMESFSMQVDLKDESFIAPEIMEGKQNVGESVGPEAGSIEENFGVDLGLDGKAGVSLRSLQRYYQKNNL